MKSGAEERASDEEPRKPGTDCKRETEMRRGPLSRFLVALPGCFWLLSCLPGFLMDDLVFLLSVQSVQSVVETLLCPFRGGLTGVCE